MDFQGVELRKTSSVNSDKVFKLLQSSSIGLSEEEVEEKRKIYGCNEIAHEKAPACYLQLRGRIIIVDTAFFILRISPIKICR